MLVSVVIHGNTLAYHNVLQHVVAELRRIRICARIQMDSLLHLHCALATIRATLKHATQHHAQPIVGCKVQLLNAPGHVDQAQRQSISIASLPSVKLFPVRFVQVLIHRMFKHATLNRAAQIVVTWALQAVALPMVALPVIAVLQKDGSVSGLPTVNATKINAVAWMAL